MWVGGISTIMSGLCPPRPSVEPPLVLRVDVLVVVVVVVGVAVVVVVVVLSWSRRG